MNLHEDKSSFDAIIQCVTDRYSMVRGECM